MKNYLILLSIVMVLSGCGFMTKVKDPVAIDTKTTVQIDKRLLQECPDLMAVSEPTEEGLLVASASWLQEYKTCRTWKSELNELVKKAFNVQ